MITSLICLKCSKNCSFLAAANIAGKPICLECYDQGTVNIQALEDAVAPILAKSYPPADERLLGEAVLALLIVIRKNKIV